MIPDPVTCFEHARFNQVQRYSVDDDSSAVIVDWFTSGRENKKEFWNFDSFNNSITLLNQDNKFLLVENQCVQNVNPENNCNSFGFLAKEFNNVHLCGILILYGKKTEAIRSSLACFQNRQTYSERFAELENEKEMKTRQIPLLSVSTINSNLTMVRFMVPTVQYGYELLAEILSPLNTELPGLSPYQDRIHYHSHAENDNESSHHVVCPIEILKAYRRQLNR
jgi:urease accessory protein UreH